MEDKSYSQMRDEFKETYKTRIKPYLIQYNNFANKEFKRKNPIGILLFVFATILFGCTFYLTRITDSQAIIMISMTITIIMYGISTGFLAHMDFEFDKKMKKKYMPLICACYGDLIWDCNNYNKLDIFTDSYLIQKYLYSIDDVFKGKYKDVSYEVVEAREKAKYPLFDGVLIKLDFNKTVFNHTIVKHKTIPTNIPGNLRKTCLEDEKFNDRYDVYTDDEVEARYILTPTFMEKLKNIRLLFSSRKIDFSFYHNYMLIAIHTSQNLFDLSYQENIDNYEKDFFLLHDQIVSIIKLIDYFKIDKKIGL